MLTLCDPALHQVALRADDLPRAIAFWRALLGAEPTAVFDPPGLVFFHLGSTRLLLDRNAPASLIYLRVPDVALAVAALRADGVQIETEPHVIFDDAEATFGPAAIESMAFFRDSENNLVGLASRTPHDA